MENLPLKRRHYPKIYALTHETERFRNEKGMCRRAVAMALLQKYMPVPIQPRLIPSADGALQTMLFTSLLMR